MDVWLRTVLRVKEVDSLVVLEVPIREQLSVGEGLSVGRRFDMSGGLVLEVRSTLVLAGADTALLVEVVLYLLLRLLLVRDHHHGYLLVLHLQDSCLLKLPLPLSLALPLLFNSAQVLLLSENLQLQLLFLCLEL